jgi:hypothetical protein
MRWYFSFDFQLQHRILCIFRFPKGQNHTLCHYVANHQFSKSFQE